MHPSLRYREDTPCPSTVESRATKQRRASRPRLRIGVRASTPRTSKRSRPVRPACSRSRPTRWCRRRPFTAVRRRTQRGQTHHHPQGRPADHLLAIGCRPSPAAPRAQGAIAPLRVPTLIRP
jgi:hypothetical protein